MPKSPRSLLSSLDSSSILSTLKPLSLPLAIFGVIISFFKPSLLYGLFSFITSSLKYGLYASVITASSLTTLSIYFSLQSRFRRTARSLKNATLGSASSEVDRLLNENERNVKELGSAGLVSSHTSFLNNYSYLPAPLITELSTLTSLIIKDFILHWFKPMSAPVMDPKFVNEVQGAISCILGQVCVDGWKRGNLGRLVAVRLVKMLEKNVYWYKIFKEEAKLEKEHDTTPFIPPTSSDNYSPPQKYISDLKFQHKISLKFLKHKRLHTAVSVDNLNNYSEEITVKEQKYLRILSGHLVKRLILLNRCGGLNKTCGIVNSLISDILANCVLNPVVNLFCSSTVNGWIKMAIDTKPEGEEGRKGLKSEDVIDGRMYGREGGIEPGRRPSFLGGGEDRGFRYFAGVMGEMESSMLLSDKNKGAFLVRVDVERNMFISLVSLDSPLSAPPEFFTEEKKKRGNFLSRDRKESEGEEDGIKKFEKMKGDAAKRTTHIRIDVTSEKFFYKERDDYYFSRLFALSEGFVSLSELLEELEGGVIFREEGIVFEEEVYGERERTESNKSTSSKKTPPATPERRPSIETTTTTTTTESTPNTAQQRPPLHTRNPTQPIHLQQQRPLFSPPSHRRRRSSGSRIKKLWVKEALEDEDVKKIIKNTPKKKTVKQKEVMTFSQASSSTPDPPETTTPDSPNLSPITSLCVDDVTIFILNDENNMGNAVNLGFTVEGTVWQTRGFIKSARRLVQAIETILRHGMKDVTSTGFTDGVVRMTSERKNRGGMNESVRLEELGFSDSDSDSDEESEEEIDDEIEDSEAGKAVRDIIARSNAEKLSSKNQGRRGTLRENAEYYKEGGNAISPQISVVTDYFNDDPDSPIIQSTNSSSPSNTNKQSPNSSGNNPSSPSPQPSTTLLLSSSLQNPSDVAGKALIAAWLQTGSTYQVMKLLVRASDSSKSQLYHSGSAMLEAKTMGNVVHILKRLNEVEIKVDTTAVIADEGEGDDDDGFVEETRNFQHSSSVSSIGEHQVGGELRKTDSPRRNMSAPESIPNLPHPLKRISSETSATSMKNPANILGNAFNKISGEIKDTAKGIRNPFKRKSQQRKSTTESLLSQLPSITTATTNDHNVDGSNPPSPPDSPMRPAHQFSTPYHHNSVTATRLRLARQKGAEAWARKTTSSTNKWSSRPNLNRLKDVSETLNKHITRMNAQPYTLQTVGPARIFEIPSDDSSLLFSPKPRPIRPIGVHNDVNTMHNFISFVATYREIVPPSPLGEMASAKGGIRVWRCVVHYYPSDRSARVEDPKWEDKKFEGDEWNKSKLPMRFRGKNSRASCRRTWGGEIGGEVTIDEFEYSPKQGQRENFQYRMSMWRKPTVNILGVTFEILDGYMVDLVGYDGSLREVSDACLSYYLLSNEKEEGEEGITISIVDGEKPVMSLSPSKVRASLCVLSSKQEIEAQALFSSGRTRRTATISPTIAMLTYATSKGGGEQLVRDLGRPGLNGCRVSLDELKAMGIYKESGMLNLECTVEGVVKQTSGGEMFAKPVILYRLRVGCERREGDDGRVVREEWIIMRRYNDFVSLHKKLKGQLTEHNPKGKLLTALEGSGDGKRMRLLPALPPKKSLNAMGVGGGTKFLEQRGKKLGNYLKYLLNRRHVLCFVVDSFNQSSTKVGLVGTAIAESTRNLTGMLKKKKGGEVSEKGKEVKGSEGKSKNNNSDARAMAFQAAMAASIKERLKEVSLREVQEGIFDLVKELLSLDKATFLRGRMISVIRGLVNFMTSGSSFHKTLLKLHNQYLTGETIGTGVKWVRELLWPNGEWKEPAEPYTLKERVELEAAVRNGIPALIPDTFTSVVGDELAEEGAKTLHEMIQNPLVLRSISFQLVDLLLLEAYPDLNIDLDALHSVED
ncbi:hypothetical protein TL16_g12336 [Triparma laevis f. inornata]|uniref:PX domain-containing protein n=1 Tax=Triparma laevis f. inornata TaxID=1714386 RepID=A0A9W7BJK7_9STRA|nr:hypothetical protein TL16_g12336 [Triparma laevis f. inornata]